MNSDYFQTVVFPASLVMNAPEVVFLKKTVKRKCVCIVNSVFKIQFSE